MSHSNQGSVVSQLESLRRQFAQAPGLPFAEVLSPSLIQQLFDEHKVEFRERDYPPLITLAMFLSQCHDADPSLRQAVARRLAPIIFCWGDNDSLLLVSRFFQCPFLLDSRAESELQSGLGWHIRRTR